MPLLADLLAGLASFGLLSLGFGLAYLPTLYRDHIAQTKDQSVAELSNWDPTYQRYAVVSDVDVRANDIVDITFAPAESDETFRRTFRSERSPKGADYPPLALLTVDDQPPNTLVGHVFGVQQTNGRWELLNERRYQKTKAPVTNPTLRNRFIPEGEGNQAAQVLERFHIPVRNAFAVLGFIATAALVAFPLVLFTSFVASFLAAAFLLVSPIILSGLYPMWFVLQLAVLKLVQRAGLIHDILPVDDIERGQLVRFTHLTGTYRVIDVQLDADVLVVQDTDDPLLITPVYQSRDRIDRPLYTCYTPFYDHDMSDGIGYCRPAESDDNQHRKE